MVIKGLVEEDFANYKKASLFLCFPNCSFKCERDCGVACCQNSDLASSPNIEVDSRELISRYISNPITSAVVIGGLEPFDDFEQLIDFIELLREKSFDDIVIYSGYNEDEIQNEITLLKNYDVIVKFGRFVPNAKHRFDKLLGVELASENQYAKRIDKNYEYQTESR